MKREAEKWNETKIVRRSTEQRHLPLR